MVHLSMRGEPPETYSYSFEEFRWPQGPGYWAGATGRFFGQISSMGWSYSSGLKQAPDGVVVIVSTPSGTLLPGLAEVEGRIAMRGGVPVIAFPLRTPWGANSNQNEVAMLAGFLREGPRP